MAQAQTLAEEILTGTWESIPRETVLLAFLMLVPQYPIPTLETGYWARQTFALIQFINLVFSSPEESQSNVQRMRN